MRVRKLLRAINYFERISDHLVKGIETNSQLVKKGYLFLCIKGHYHDGHDFVGEAISRGAKTIVHERDIEKIQGINYVQVDDTKKALAQLANCFYHYLTLRVKMIGVTGTNGKTTIATLLHNFLTYKGVKSLFIGTSGINFGDEHYEINNTTPDILLTLRILSTVYRKGCRTVVMEVSSQAIQEMRVYGFDFNIGIFTNLTPEHLDYHKNMTDYKYSKGLFIRSVSNKKGNFVVLNKDDLAYSTYYKIAVAPVYSYSIKQQSDYMAININKSMENGTSFKVVHNYEKTSLKTFLIGEFNVYNILAVVATIQNIHMSMKDFIRFLKIYVLLQGRMETIKIGGRTFIIDYAHTPDSVLNVCKNIREYANSQLIIVIGCGGNRDRKKRPKIGEIVTNYADFVIFTNDNPRDEIDYMIIEDILVGTVKNNYEVILNREQAIKRAIEKSHEQGIIAVLGKGSETWQMINNIKYPFSDKEVIKRLMKKEGYND